MSKSSARATVKSLLFMVSTYYLGRWCNLLVEILRNTMDVESSRLKVFVIILNPALWAKKMNSRQKMFFAGLNLNSYTRYFNAEIKKWWKETENALKIDLSLVCRIL